MCFPSKIVHSAEVTLVTTNVCIGRNWESWS